MSSNGTIPLPCPSTIGFSHPLNLIILLDSITEITEKKNAKLGTLVKERINNKATLVKEPKKLSSLPVG